LLGNGALQISYTSTVDLAFWVVPWAIALVVFLAAAMRALVLRRVITVRLRRNQALGIGLVAIGMAWFALNLLLPLPSQLQSGTSGDIYFVFQIVLPFLVFFYWVDASVLSSRRVDPLMRDSFGWSRVRKWVWALIAFCLALGIVGTIVLGDILQVTAFSVNSPISGSATLIILGAPFAGGLILLPVAAKRSGDPAIRFHLRWFAYFAGSLGLGVALVVLTGFPPLWSGLWIVSGYCLYRSVGSLVVVSRLPSDLAARGNRGP